MKWSAPLTIAGIVIAAVLLPFVVPVTSTVLYLLTLVGADSLDSFDDYSKYGTPYDGGRCALSNDGTTLYYSSPQSGRGDIIRLTMDTRQTETVAASDSFEADPSLSHDEKLLLFRRGRVDESAIWLVNLETGQEAQMTFPKGCADREGRFLNGDRQLEYLRETPSGQGAYASRRRVNRDHMFDELLSSDVSFELENGITVGTRFDSDVRHNIVWLRPSNQSAEKTLGFGGEIAASPDSQRVAFAGTYVNPGIYLYDTIAERLDCVYVPKGFLGSPSFSANGKWIAALESEDWHSFQEAIVIDVGQRKVMRRVPLP